MYELNNICILVASILFCCLNVRLTAWHTSHSSRLRYTNFTAVRDTHSGLSRHSSGPRCGDRFYLEIYIFDFLISICLSDNHYNITFSFFTCSWIFWFFFVYVINSIRYVQTIFYLTSLLTHIINWKTHIIDWHFWLTNTKNWLSSKHRKLQCMILMLILVLCN